MVPLEYSLSYSSGIHCRCGICAFLKIHWTTRRKTCESDDFLNNYHEVSQNVIFSVSNTSPILKHGLLLVPEKEEDAGLLFTGFRNGKAYYWALLLPLPLPSAIFLSLQEPAGWKWLDSPLFRLPKCLPPFAVVKRNHWEVSMCRGYFSPEGSISETENHSSVLCLQWSEAIASRLLK